MTAMSDSVSASTLAISSHAVVRAEEVVSGTVHVDAGRICGFEPGPAARGAMEWCNDYLIPGLVELHTDHLEPHYSPRPNVLWDPVAAVVSYDAQIAASGITTVFDSLRAGSDGDRHTLCGGLQTLGAALNTASKADMLRVQHLTHLRCEICSDDVIEETERFLSSFDVHLISLMDHTPGVRQFRDEAKLRDYYRGRSTKTDAEMDTFIAQRLQSHARNHDRHRSLLVAIALKRRIALASHDDTTIEHVRESVTDGIRIAEFPTTMEAAAASHAAGLAVMMGAPNVVRGGSHSGNVAARTLAEAGILDVLSSDYVPASLLQGAWMLASIPAVGGLPGAIRAVTKAPARAAGLDDRGEIAVGLRADLIRVSMFGNVPVVREVYCGGRRVA
jgi:alpha-D-ribose 1-methylphosphonate 5-triphosphate diphosphatase